MIYDICLSLSDLFHSLGRSLDPSMLLQMASFCSFLWRSSIPLYICTTVSFCIHLPMDTGCFHVLVTVNSVVKIWVHISFRNSVCYLAIYPEVELVDHLVGVILSF